MFRTPAATFKTFIFVSLGILIFGDIMVFSAAQVTGLTIGGNSFTISGKQIVLSVISVLCAWVIAQIPIVNVKKIARVALFLALGIMLLLIPFGVDVNGNKNWVSFGPLGFQPSEVAKLLLIIWAAVIIERNFHNPRQIFFQVTFGFALVLSIVLLGGDLGSAVVIGLILASLVYLAGADNKLIGLLGGLGILGVAGLIAIQPYRIARFTAFIHPFADGIYKNAGWQPAHSLMALGSGGLFGSGIGSSKQKWGNLAEAHTDFIFGVIGEEFGLVGTLSVLLLLGALIYSIFKISLRAEQPFIRFACAGIGCWIFIQSFLNIGSATSVLPVVGVTLPLISYGGSALVATLCAIGFVAGAALRDPAVRSELMKKRRA